MQKKLTEQGLRLLQSGQIEEAELAFQGAVDQNPDQIEPRYNLAHFYFTSAEYEKAIGQYNYILNKHPLHYLSLRGVILSLLLSGDISEALMYTNKWIVEYDDYDEPHYFHGLCLFTKKDYTGALKAYDRALEILPTNYDVVTAVGTCYKEMGNLSIAERYLLKSLNIESHNPTALFHLGEVYWKKGLADDARELFTKAINLDDDYPEPREALRRINNS